MTYSYEDMQKELSRFGEEHGEAEIYTFGRSARMRELVAVDVGRGERKLLMVGGHHGREYVSSAFVMRSMEQLMFVGGAPDGTAVTFVPMINPDGVEISAKGGDALTDKMEMLGTDTRSWKANGNGVDLNRHYPARFGEKANLANGPASEGFGGYAPATEPEAVSLMELCHKKSFLIGATFHSKGETIIYGDANTPGIIPESLIIAEKLASSTGYDIAPVSMDPASYGGGFENWFRQTFGRPCILVELAPSDGTDLPFGMERFAGRVWSRCRNVCSVLAGCLFDV